MKNHTLLGLIELGLEEKEAQLYLSAIKLGPATAQQLARDSELKRATVYPYINALVEKGLFHLEVNGMRKLFVAEPPDRLVTFLDRKKQVLTNIMPLLVQDYAHSSLSDNTIKIYSGLSGIKLIYDEILDQLKDGDEYLVITDQQKWHQLDPRFFERFIQERSKLNLIIKLIFQDSPFAHTYKKNKNYQHEQVKLLPGNINLNINMVILPTAIILVQLVEPLSAILIKNLHVAAMNKTLFDIMWTIL